jgi:hypothetical protein
MPTRKKPSAKGKSPAKAASASCAAKTRRLATTLASRAHASPPNPPVNTRTTKKGTPEQETTPVECSASPAKPPANAQRTKKGTQQLAADSAHHAEKPSPLSSTTRKSARAGKGSLGDTPKLAVAHPRGRGRVLPQTLEAVDEEMGAAISKDAGVVIDSPIAAAASMLVYQLAYGDGSESNGDQEDKDVDDWEDDDMDDRLSDSDYSIPEGLVFSDDEDVLVIEADSDDEFFRSSFPKDKSCTKNLILGGPQPPDLSNYLEDEKKDVWKAYKKKGKPTTTRSVTSGPRLHGMLVSMPLFILGAIMTNFVQ